MHFRSAGMADLIEQVTGPVTKDDERRALITLCYGGAGVYGAFFIYNLILEAMGMVDPDPTRGWHFMHNWPTRLIALPLGIGSFIGGVIIGPILVWIGVIAAIALLALIFVVGV